MSHLRLTTGPTWMMACLVSLCGACGSANTALEAHLPPLDIAEAIYDEPTPFIRDRTGAISEEDLLTVIDAPVFLEEDRRLGIVPVAIAYEPDEEIPLVEVPEVLGQALEDTGFFTVASEISTDWPSDRSIAGLRELAARYRTRYLLLYRHRFVERETTNAWATTWIMLVPILFVPSESLELAGVLEATLFDVRSGTILFTVYERVSTAETANIWNNEGDFREMRQELLDAGALELANKVTNQVHRLVAARPVDSPAQTNENAAAVVSSNPSAP